MERPRGGFLCKHAWRNAGRWRGETRNYTDEIRIFTVLDFRDETALGENFLKKYKEMLKMEFQQEEILILYQEMKTL